MQSTDENDMLSWFQVAGIHGRPHIPWNNATRGVGTYDLGYCTHGEFQGEQKMASS